MPLTPNDKRQLVSEYDQILQNSSGFLVFQYRGLTVQQFGKLRDKIRDAGGNTQVVKNRLLKLAIGERPYTEVVRVLEGPNAIVFLEKDPVAPTKALVDYAKDNDKVQIIAGVVNDSVLDAAQVGALSKVPPIEHLYAMILGGVKAPASNVLGGIKGLHQKLHGLIRAYGDKLGEAA